MKTGRISAAKTPCWSLRAWPRQSRRKVHGEALARRAQHLRQRRLQARVGVADRQLDADPSSGNEASEELAPERLGLGLADVQADDLPPPGLMHRVGDHTHLCTTGPPARTFSTLASTNTYG